MASTLTSPSVSGGITANASAAAGSHKNNIGVSNQSAWQPVVGSSAGQVNKCCDFEITIADSSTPSTIDLTAAVDVNGDTQNFSVVNAIQITNESTVAGQDVTPFGGTNGLYSTGTVPIPAGTKPGAHTFNLGTTGKTVDSTHKIIQLAVAAGTNVKVLLTVLGK